MRTPAVAALLFMTVCAGSLAAEPAANDNTSPQAAMTRVGNGAQQSSQDAATPSGRWPSVMSTGMRSSNLERSIRFYTEGLGMIVLTKLVSGPVTEVIFGFQGKNDQPGLIVFQTKGADASLPVEHGNADTKVVLGVADMAAVVARLSSAGYPAGEIRQHGPYKTLVAHDPDGYKYEIVEMPAARTSRQGRIRER
jgi:catechol 2,3-dioxygenase-like lactoylglutathione lyase family enzyme